MNETLLALRTVAASLRAVPDIVTCLWVSVMPYKASTCNRHSKCCRPRCHSGVSVRAVCSVAAADDRVTQAALSTD